MPARTPKRSRLSQRWPLLRRLFGKGVPVSAGHDANAAIIRDYFRDKAHSQGYTLSRSQQHVIDCMAQQASVLLGDSGLTPPSLYLYGAVGRGKSWLLDGFFQALPITRKRRLHFHQFFARLHEGMFRHRQQEDALGITLDELLEDCQALCFDEFHVHDIGDAMLITRLFKALFKRRIMLLVTSNYAPEGLLPNPLYHARFKPVIELINTRMQVMEVGGAHDYRTLNRQHTHQVFTQGHYVWPATSAQRQALNLPPADAPALALEVGKRQLPARLCEGRRIAFTFNDLCEQPTAVMDYLQLCQRFDQWIIDDLPQLGECPIAVQQRFINLIDVLYDQDKHLTLLGQLPLGQSLEGHAIDLARTRSRLGQLQEIHESD